MSLLGRLRDGLRRTAAQLGGRFDEVVGTTTAAGVATFDPETFEALEAVLLQADVGVTATDRIIGRLRQRDDRNDTGGLRELVKQEIREILASAHPGPSNRATLRVVLVVGVNGTGKTTTVGKLARLMQREGQRPLICAADTFRAAAVDQLEIWAARAGVEIVKAGPGTDPAAVVFDAIQAGRARGRDVVIVDTAGRLHTRVDLMAELEKVRRVAAREVDGAPHEVLLVLDATVGQNGLTQAREFLQRTDVTGIVLTKVDGTAKGGIAVAVVSELGLPIRYVGVGEALEDLLPFSSDAYVDALFTEQW